VIYFEDVIVTFVPKMVSGILSLTNDLQNIGL